VRRFSVTSLAIMLIPSRQRKYALKGAKSSCFGIQLQVAFVKRSMLVGAATFGNLFTTYLQVASS
jgi:hypothetical protein